MDYRVRASLLSLRYPLVGRPAAVNPLIGLVTLSVCIAIAASSELVGACEAALTRPQAVISTTRTNRFAYECDDITLGSATVRTRQAALASVRPHPAALDVVPSADR